MNKTLKVLLAAVVLGIGMSVRSEATGSNRGAKGMVANNYNTAVVIISTGPSVLYGVLMTTVTTAGDYTVVWDSASVTGLAVGGPFTLLKAKLTGSTTAQTTIPGSQFATFDPPLQFNSGIATLNSAATNGATFVFEKGRVVQGY